MGCLKLHTTEYPDLKVSFRKEELTSKESNFYERRDWIYGFNGMERDDEIAGNGNSYTAEFWQYDSRLGRRWNVDPMASSENQIGWSPYKAFYDNPITFTDETGACEECEADEVNKDYKNSNADGTFEKTENGKTLTATLKDGKYTGESVQSWNKNAAGITVQNLNDMGYGYKSGTGTYGTIDVLKRSADEGLRNLDGTLSTPFAYAGEKLESFSRELGNKLPDMQSSGLRVKAELGFNKYSVGLELGTYSTTENNIGLSGNVFYQVQGDLKYSTAKGFSSKLLDFKPQLKVEGFLLMDGNEMSTNAKTYVSKSTFTEFRAEGLNYFGSVNSKMQAKIGIGISTAPAFSGALKNKTSFNFQSSTLNMLW